MLYNHTQQSGKDVEYFLWLPRRIQGIVDFVRCAGDAFAGVPRKKKERDEIIRVGVQCVLKLRARPVRNLKSLTTDLLPAFNNLVEGLNGKG
jgi:hypothetical protein